MRDHRADALARILVHYSTGVREGDVTLIQAESAAEPLALAVYEEVVQAGGLPIVELIMEGQAAAYFKHARTPSSTGFRRRRSGRPRTRTPASG